VRRGREPEGCPRGNGVIVLQVDAGVAPPSPPLPGLGRTGDVIGDAEQRSDSSTPDLFCEDGWAAAASLSGLTGSWRYGRPIPVVAHAGGSLRYGLSIVRSGLVISGWNWEPTISSKDGPARVVEPIPWAIGNAFLVESWWALAPTTITAIRVMLQAALEDRTVRSEPTTHQERAGHVRYGSRYSNA